MSKYDFKSESSIIEYAKELKNQTLRLACGKEIEKHNYLGKGNFGQLLEKFYFGYEPNSDSEPDFKEAGIELKSSPLKTLKNKQLRAKERVVLNIINYLKVHEETFEESSFWKKNKHLLFVFYLHSKYIDLLDYPIKLVDDWSYPEGDLKVIRQDWEFINRKIKDGRAHELSEGDTFYLGACTKGSTALKSLRDQPFNNEKAKQRAYSLKQGYVNHIIAKISQGEKQTYGKLIHKEGLVGKKTIEDLVLEKFIPFYGFDANIIAGRLNRKLNEKSKSYYSDVTQAILGFKRNQKIEEFEKADVQIKTIRLSENNFPEQEVSFPSFEYEKIVETDWEDSDFKNVLESKFLFVFFKFEGGHFVLKKAKFWNMPFADILEAKQVWDRTVKLIERGKIVKKVMYTKKGKRIRRTYFPKKSEHRVSHVRPHATNSEDTYSLPYADKLTKATEYTKHCFWLNKEYVRDEIYLKTDK